MPKLAEYSGEVTANRMRMPEREAFSEVTFEIDPTRSYRGNCVMEIRGFFDIGTQIIVKVETI